MTKSKNGNDDTEKISNVAIDGAAAETVQRYGSANAEHLKAYNGDELKRTLKSVSESKVNPDYKSRNISQQAGFSAEIKTVAKKNAENIINKKSDRYIRTDDIQGRVNDTVVDILVLDKNGNVIPGTTSQMKFVGKDGNSFVQHFMGNSKAAQKWRSYLENDNLAIIEVPKDKYDDIKKNIADRLDKLNKTLKKAREAGDNKKETEIIKKIKTLKKLDSKVKAAVLTKKAAEFARLHPGLSTAGDMIKVANQAGVNQMKYGAAISGAVALVKNIIAVSNGTENSEHAARNMVIETGEGTVISYSTAFSGSIIQGLLDRSKSKIGKSLSKTNFAAGMTSATIDICRSLHRYITGEIDAEACIEDLGKNGFGEIESAVYSSIGIALIPKKSAEILIVVGGIAGASFGYIAASAIYEELVDALKNAKIADEERRKIEKQCNASIAMIKSYRNEMEQMVIKYMREHYSRFDTYFSIIDKAVLDNDVDGFIAGNNDLQEYLGHKAQFESVEEFNRLMDDKASPLVL